MSYRIVGQVFMLQETISMLYKFVNGITFTDLLIRWKVATDENKDDPRILRLNRLQQIMDQLCADLDPDDPELQYFFSHAECGCEDLCLAQLITYSFYTLEKADLWGHVNEICGIWKQLQERGCWIHPSSMANLNFSDGPDCPGDLCKQLQVLNYSARFRADLRKALKNFEPTLFRLAELVEPLADRLKTSYDQEPWLFEDLLTYWKEQFQHIEPLELLTSLGAGEEKQGAGEETWVGLSLMNTNTVFASMTGDCVFGLKHNCLMIGSAITPTSRVKRRGADLDSVSTILKCLCDRNRLEVLHQLSIGRSYGQALAETLGMDPGNLSRNLAMLHSYGFLKQERGPWRTYYETDPEALRKFMLRAVDIICTGP